MPAGQPDAATTFDLSEINGTPPQRVEPPPESSSQSGGEVAPLPTLTPTSTTRTEISPPPSKPEGTASPSEAVSSPSPARVSTDAGTSSSLPRLSTDSSEPPTRPRISSDALPHSDTAGSLPPVSVPLVDLLKPSDSTNRHPIKDKDKRDETGSSENPQGLLQVIAASPENPAPPPAPGARAQSKHHTSDNGEAELLRDKASTTPLSNVLSTGLPSLKPSSSDAEIAGQFLPPIKIEGRTHSSPETTKPASAAVKLSILPGLEVVTGTTSDANVVSDAPSPGGLHGAKAAARKDLTGSLERLLPEEIKLPPAAPVAKNKGTDTPSGSHSTTNDPEQKLASPVVALQNAIGSLLPRTKDAPVSPDNTDAGPAPSDRLKPSTNAGDQTEPGQVIQKTVKQLENIVGPLKVPEIKFPEIKFPEIKLTETKPAAPKTDDSGSPQPVLKGALGPVGEVVATANATLALINNSLPEVRKPIPKETPLPPTSAQTALQGELTRLLSNDKNGSPDIAESKPPVSKPISFGDHLKTAVENSGAIGAPIVVPVKTTLVENTPVKPAVLNRQNAEIATGPIAAPALNEIAKVATQVARVSEPVKQPALVDALSNNSVPTTFDRSSVGKTVDTVSISEQNVSRQKVGNLTPISTRAAEVSTTNGGATIDAVKVEVVNSYNRIASVSVANANVIGSFARVDSPSIGKDTVLPVSVPAARLDASVSISGKLSIIDSNSKIKTDATAGNITVNTVLNVSTVKLQTAGQPKADITSAATAVSSVVKVDANANVKTDSSAVKVDFVAVVKAEQPSVKSDVAGSLKGDVSLGTKGDAVASAKVEVSTAVKTDAVGGLKTDVANAGKSETANGIKPDSINNVKVDANNGTRADVNSGFKVDVNQGIKADVAGSKIDSGIGRPIDGIKSDAGGRSALTPQMVATIADAIRLGLPLPDGVASQNGEIALRYNNEVLYFPGLKAALKFAEVVGLIEAEVTEEDANSDSGRAGLFVDTRVRYSVKEGETVESIAAVQLGDTRFADLIITINRAEILYRLVEEAKVPFVYAGQVIWLPSDPELNVYRKNFFSKKSGGVNPAAPRLSGEVTAQKDSNSREALQEEFIDSCAPQKIPSPRTTVRDLPQMQLSDSIKNVASAINVDESDADFGPSTVLVAQEAERLLDVKLIARDARIIVSDYASEPSRSFIKLEINVDGMWVAASVYDCAPGATSRTRNGKNGVTSTMMLHLPSNVVRTMAIEDFSRNWSTYRSNYIAGNVKNNLVDSVPPTPVDFARRGIRFQPSA